MAGRRVAIIVPLTLALLLGDGDGVHPHGRPQSLSQDCSGLQLSEFLPEPLEVDWDGDGSVDSRDEWIELYNGGDTPCDLLHWGLDHRASTDPSPSFVITQTTLVAPDSYIVFFRRETGVVLRNDADCVQLYSPEATFPDEEACYYGGVDYDKSCCRAVGGLSWECPCPYLPTPGRANDEWYECYLPLVSRGR
jgi:hypothetical protein